MAQRMIRIDDSLYTDVSQLAHYEGRSVSNMASYLIREGVEQLPKAHTLPADADFGPVKVYDVPVARVVENGKVIDSVDPEEIGKSESDVLQFCKHSAAKGFCKFKECK